MPTTQIDRDTPIAPVGQGDSLSILWLLNFFTDPNILDGATLRFLNYARELRAAGHRVFFLVPDWSFKKETMETLVARGDIDGYEVLEGYRSRGWLAALSQPVYPAFRYPILRGRYQPTIDRLNELIERYQADVMLFSERMHLFALRSLRHRIGTVVDWTDSWMLNGWRSLVQALALREWGRVKESASQVFKSFAEERHYSQMAGASLVVSPVDAKVIRTLSGCDESIHVLMNGVHVAEVLEPVAKDPDRLIFSGSMSFPPNVDAAVWFIDHVLPIVLKRRPGVRFIVAGTNPADVIRARASDHVIVTGAVPDLNDEIRRSALYVAPLVSGGGFKNKVVEALSAGTFLIGTSMAVEFLSQELKDCVRVADDPQSFADAVVECLEKPDSLIEPVERARKLLARDFSWRGRTRELLSVISKARQKARQNL